MTHAISICGGDTLPPNLGVQAIAEGAHAFAVASHLLAPGIQSVGSQTIVSISPQQLLPNTSALALGLHDVLVSGPDKREHAKRTTPVGWTGKGVHAFDLHAARTLDTSLSSWVSLALLQQLHFLNQGF